MTMQRWQQYRPLMPMYQTGKRQYRKPYVHVTRRTRKLGSPRDGMGSASFRALGGGFTVPVVVGLSVLGLAIWYFADIAVKG